MLHLCPSCHRHIRSSTHCPFCSFTRPAPAALLAVGLALSACAAYGNAPVYTYDTDASDATAETTDASTSETADAASTDSAASDSQATHIGVDAADATAPHDTVSADVIDQGMISPPYMAAAP